MRQFNCMLHTTIVLCVLFFSLLILVDAKAHHGKPAKLYICKLVASAQMNSTYSGGDGTRKAEGFLESLLKSFVMGSYQDMVHGNSERRLHSNQRSF